MVAVLPHKEIKSKIEIMPNYFWHVFVLANLWDYDQSDNPYYSKYIGTIPKEDINFLRRYRKDIIWGDGNMGDLAKFIYFMPLESPDFDLDDLEFYYKRLCHAVFSNDWVDFYLWYGSDFGQIKIPRDKFIVIEKIGQILVKNFKAFNEKVWVNIYPELKRFSQSFNEHFSNCKFINKWENFLNRDFEGKDFNILFTIANTKEIRFTNINYFRYCMYYNSEDIQSLTNLIIKEIGINILSPELHKLLEDKNLKESSIFYENHLYTAFQAFVQTSTEKIFTDINLQYKNDYYTYDKGSYYFFKSFFKEYFEKHDYLIDAYQVIKNSIYSYIDDFYEINH